jgi:multidrug efflux pump subunit AcrA (membrane-fusion protein)
MSGSRWTVDRGRRRSLIALGLAGALAVAGCGGSASQAPGSDAGGSTAPGESTAPAESQPTEPTEAPTEPVEAGDGGEAFTAATTALDALDSYAFRVELDSTTVDGTTTTTSHSLYSGVVVKRPTEANSLQISELDADGNVTSGTEFIVIGAGAWLKDAGDTAWTAMPAAQMGSFFAAFRPEQMFGTYFAGIGGNFREVGTESKNGVEATHYQGDEAVGSILGTIAGFSGNWHSDVWIANDGGFLVHSEAGAEAATGSDAGSFLIVVDITDPNSAGPIEPPA